MEEPIKVALVTGGAVRIGRAISKRLAGAGMRVIVHYRNSQEAADELAGELNQSGDLCRTVSADLSVEDQVLKLYQEASSYWGRIDLLVNNAAIYYKTPFADLTLADWDEMMKVNLRSPFHTSLLFGRYMKSQGHGCIINIADWSTERPYADYLPYSVSKSGLIALTMGLARALAPEVRVNAVSPGAVMMPDNISPETIKLIAKHTLIKQIGKPEDIAEAVKFLAQSEFITGSNIIVDGGRWICDYATS